MSKYYRRHAQVGPGLGVGGGKKMHFFNWVAGEPQLCIVKQLAHWGLWALHFVAVFLPESLKTGVGLFTDSVCLRRRVGAHFLIFIFNGRLQLGSLTWWIAGPSSCLEGMKTKQPRGGPGAGRKHLAGGVASSPGEVWRQRPLFPLQIDV